MRIYRFDREVAWPIEQFESRGVAIGRCAVFDGDTRVGCFHFDSGGVVGFHEATVPQLFLCVSGAGWVRGPEGEPTPIQPGQAAFWEAGEWHESGTNSGMAAVVIEGTQLDPGGLMPELERDAGADA